MILETELILKQAKKLYGVEMVHEITRGYSGNRIFEVTKGQTQSILRIYEYSPEKEAHTCFELKWMVYLSDYLAGIVRPIKSVDNTLYETVTAADKTYILCLLEKAPGKLVDINSPKEFNETLFYNLGALMGNMHRLTVDYADNIRKPDVEWTGPVNSWRYNTVIFDDNVRLCLQAYYDEINTLPIGKENYGIIHWDIHTDNFFVNHGKIHLFDFEACQFNWYAADVASAIFFIVLKGAGPLMRKSEKERTAFAEACLVSYLKGYLKTNRISAYWIRKIDLFMKYQMGDEYIFVQNFWPPELVHEKDFYLRWHKERITKGLPYVFIDYEKAINSLSSQLT